MSINKILTAPKYVLIFYLIGRAIQMKNTLRISQIKGRSNTAKVSPAISLLAITMLALSPTAVHATGSGAQRPVLHNPNVARVLVQTPLLLVREAARKSAEEVRRKRSAASADGSAAEPKTGR